jgi:hypothetical protein
MNIRLATLAIVLMATALPAAAGDNPFKILARESGLSERKVHMVLGTRTAYAEYPYTYQRSVEKLRDTIGNARYDHLMNDSELIVASPQAKAEALVAVLRERDNDSAL